MVPYGKAVVVILRRNRDSSRHGERFQVALVVSLVLVLVLGLSLGCEGQRPALPSATSASASVPEIIQQVIDRTLKDDVDGLIAMVAFQDVACVKAGEEGNPFPCRAGEQPGTIVEAFPAIHCDGSPARRDEMNRAFESFLSVAPFGLYAVTRPKPDGGLAPDYAITFAYRAPAQGYAFTLELRGGRITSLLGYCGTDWPQIVQRSASEFIIEPMTPSAAP